MLGTQGEQANIATSVQRQPALYAEKRTGMDARRQSTDPAHEWALGDDCAHVAVRWSPALKQCQQEARMCCQ